MKIIMDVVARAETVAETIAHTAATGTTAMDTIADLEDNLVSI